METVPKICSLFNAKDNHTYSTLNFQYFEEWKKSKDPSDQKNLKDLHPIKLNRDYRFPKCYLCCQRTEYIHWFYHYLCPACGEASYQLRNVSRDLSGRRAIVTGGRLKLGYQIALKLLRSGAEVIVTSRKWTEALERYHTEPDYEMWKDRLFVLRVNFDLMIIDELLPLLVQEIERIWPDGCVDIIIHNAAQTIFNVPEIGSSGDQLFGTSEDIRDVLKRSSSSEDGKTILKKTSFSEYSEEKSLPRSEFPLRQKLPYPPAEWSDDPFPDVDKYGRMMELRKVNTWTTRFGDVNPNEAKQVLIANSWAPFVLNQFIMPYLNRSAIKNQRKSFIIHVHAKEGHFSSHKTLCHTHTNMAKASLCMLTRCLAAPYSTRATRWDYQRKLLEKQEEITSDELPDREILNHPREVPWLNRFRNSLVDYEVPNQSPREHLISENISIHGVDPGWFSIDEYGLEMRRMKNLLFPPVDEFDAASRILYPIIMNMDSFPGTWRHYIPLLDY